MINRSTIKYSIKKVVPPFLFTIILFLWQKLLLGAVEFLDIIRLKKFTDARLVTLHQSTHTFKLYISPRNGFIDNYIFLYGVYESFMLDIITEHLHEGMTYVDIGANIGQHSMYASTLVGRHGSVYAFEPIPHVYEQLIASAKANHFEHIVYARNIALGEKESTETLYVSKKNIGGSSLVNQEEGTEQIHVTVKHGDNELSLIPSIDMIKIDVEGYEYEVLSGIKHTLIKHKPLLLLEFSGYFYEQQHNDNGAKILSLLNEIGYSIYDIEDDMKEIKNFQHFLHLFKHDRKQTNLLCKAK
jgi:FkbM family methyltransferase